MQDSARITSLRCELVQLTQLLRETEELEDDGVCCCGELMENHSSPMACGHSPRSQNNYLYESISQKVRLTENAIERLTDPAFVWLAEQDHVVI